MITVCTQGTNVITNRPITEVLPLACANSKDERHLVIVNFLSDTKDESFSYENGELVGYQDNRFFDK